MFHPLEYSQLCKIVDIQIGLLAERLSEKEISIELSDETKLYLAKVGFDPVYGARPLKRTIVQFVETPLSRMIISGQLPDGAKVTLAVTNNQIVFDVT